MKSIKIITLVLGIVLMSSCNHKEKSMNTEFTMVYKVYFTPTESRTYTETIICDEDGGIFLKSNKGTNYILVCTGKGLINENCYSPFATSAPIEIISYCNCIAPTFPKPHHYRTKTFPPLSLSGRGQIDEG